jgi:H+/Cl- antiporter ClcA
MLALCYDNYAHPVITFDQIYSIPPRKYMSKWVRLGAHLAQDLIKWCSISSLAGLITGTTSAVLLATLDWATRWRETHYWIIFLLPLGGLVSGLIYYYLGKSVEAGNNLLLEEIYDPQQIIPWRMSPLVLIGTAIAHLVGASVGREGTAVQMGAAMVDALVELLRQQLTPYLQLDPLDRRIVLMTGISGGFASVFGTPFAGMVFGWEVLSVGKFRHQGLVPCLIAAIVGDRMTLAWGLHHQAYDIPFVPALTLWSILAAMLAGIIFGLTARVFASLTHRLSDYFKATISYPPFRPLMGGILVAIAMQLAGTSRYSGLGIPTIVNAFDTQLNPWDFAAKIGLTALSLGSGFKGGEVTPLFFIGATLGNALAPILLLPAPLLAGMGFVGVFAGAANTPIAGIFMAIELFGGAAGSYLVIACIVSYLCSGYPGIYRSQKIGLGKYTDSKDREFNSEKKF